MTETESTDLTTTRAGPTYWTEFDRWFDDLPMRLAEAWGAPFGPFESPVRTAPGALGRRVPRLDVADLGPSYAITAEVPGIPKDRLDIRVRGASVEIRGDVTETKEEKEPEFLHRERRVRGFYRALELPEPVIGQDAKARLVDGILHLELPKEHPAPSPAEVRLRVE